MSIEVAMQHAKHAMLAETQRMNAVASNIANANTESTNLETAYKAKKVVFERVLNKATGQFFLKANSVVESRTPHQMQFDPGHPLANEDGYVVKSNVNVTEEMTDLMSATQSFENNANVASAMKQMMNKTLQMGK